MVSSRYFDKHPIEEELLDIYKAFKEEHNDKITEFSQTIYEQVIDCILRYLRNEERASSKLINSLEICRRPM